MVKIKKYSLKFWITSFLPLTLWMSIIFYFSSQQKIAVTNEYWLSFAIFKTLHLIEYATLYALSLRFFHYLNSPQKYLYAFILTVAYAATDELHQRFVPTREGKPRDVFIDSLGALASFLIIKNTPLLKRIIFL